MADSDDALFGQEHVRAYRETGGARGYNWRGTTILLLTTKGRSSGEQRTTPLIHTVDGDRWVVIASKGGAPDHPAWFKNLEADRRATVITDAAKDIKMMILSDHLVQRGRAHAHRQRCRPRIRRLEQRLPRHAPTLLR